MQIHSNIAQKKFKKLTLQVASDGFSYVSTDTFSNSVIIAEQINFAGLLQADKVEEHYWKAFVDRKALTTNYDQVLVLHNNNLNTFVPKALYEEEFAGSYLQYNTKVFETDVFATDALHLEEMVNVYIPYMNINNFLIDQFGQFEYKHAGSILVPHLLRLSRNLDDKQVFVHFNQKSFEIVVAQNGRLILYNSFEYQTAADFVYYLLFTAEQLRMNPENFNLQLLGQIDEDNEAFVLAYKYVRHIKLLDASLLPSIAGFNEKELRQYFIQLLA